MQHFRFVAVGYCSGSGLPSWYVESGLVKFVFEEAPLDCPHPLDVTRLALRHYQVG